jgi:acetoacetyl-CoA synthetase
MNSPLWQPEPRTVERANMTRFRKNLSRRFEVELADYDSLYDFSITRLEDFWNAFWDYSGIIGDKGKGPFITDADSVFGARFFPRGKLNFAENLLRSRTSKPALVFRGEGTVERTLSGNGLYDLVSRLRSAFAENGLGAGDRVAAMLPNMPETIAVMLAATSLGAIWSSCSPDFGVTGVLDRFGQIEPKFFITSDHYEYNGKTHDVRGKAREIASRLETLEETLIIPYSGEMDADIPGGMVTLEAFIAAHPPQEIEFERFAFDHPLYILFSSGTTGKPKCIVHGAGGTLLQHLKEHILHCDIKPGERLFYFTTCGWMMWNWLVSGLAAEATVLLFDGSPFYPHPRVLFDFAEDTKMNIFGTSAKYIDALKKDGLIPMATHNLKFLRLMCSTGSPLAAESFEYVYNAIKSDMQLASIAGGTDIVSCFVLGNPLRPVWRGEIQGAGLGMAVKVFNDKGEPVHEEKGELVCTKPFPSRPVKFWNDEEGRKYHKAYFERFENCWHHGDLVELTAHDGIIMHGRSDATLNPGGVRIGTSEIYGVVEQMDEIKEALAIGQQWNDDVRIILFTVLAEGVTLDDELIGNIRNRIRTGASPRHMPAKVIAIADIPRTKSGKITEIAVRDIIHGREVKNMEALANPEALELYRDLPELKI